MDDMSYFLSRCYPEYLHVIGQNSERLSQMQRRLEKTVTALLAYCGRWQEKMGLAMAGELAKNSPTTPSTPIGRSQAFM